MGCDNDGQSWMLLLQGRSFVVLTLFVIVFLQTIALFPHTVSGQELMSGPCNPLPICDHGKKYGDPEDCQWYYWCIHGEYEHHWCPSGLFFDIDTEVCTFDWDANCQAPCPTFGNLPSAFPTVGRTPGPCEEDEATCLRGSGEGIMYPDQVYCNVYYLCTQSSMHQYDCPPGTVFDFYEQMCDHKDDSIDCINRCNRDPVRDTTPRDEVTSAVSTPDVTSERTTNYDVTSSPVETSAKDAPTQSDDVTSGMSTGNTKTDDVSDSHETHTQRASTAKQNSDSSSYYSSSPETHDTSLFPYQSTPSSVTSKDPSTSFAKSTQSLLTSSTDQTKAIGMTISISFENTSKTTSHATTNGVSETTASKVMSTTKSTPFAEQTREQTSPSFDSNTDDATSATDGRVTTSLSPILSSLATSVHTTTLSMYQPCEQDLERCLHQRKYPDQVQCSWYYFCELFGLDLEPAYCDEGEVFNFYHQNCTTDLDSVDCDNRCDRTPPTPPSPTTTAAETTTSTSLGVVESTSATEDLTQESQGVTMETSLWPQTSTGILETTENPIDLESTPSSSQTTSSHDVTSPGSNLSTGSGDSTLDLVTSTHQPDASTLESRSSTVESHTSSQEPRPSTIESQTSSSESSSSTIESQTSSSEPSSSTVESQTSSSEPSSSTVESQTSSSEPSSSTTESQTSSLESQSTTLESHITTLESHPSTFESQASTSVTDTSTLEHPTSSPLPTTTELEQETTTFESQSSTVTVTLHPSDKTSSSPQRSTEPVESSSTLLLSSLIPSTQTSQRPSWDSFSSEPRTIRTESSKTTRPSDSSGQSSQTTEETSSPADVTDTETSDDVTASSDESTESFNATTDVLITGAPPSQRSLEWYEIVGIVAGSIAGIAVIAGAVALVYHFIPQQPPSLQYQPSNASHSGGNNDGNNSPGLVDDLDLEAFPLGVAAGFASASCASTLNSSSPSAALATYYEAMRLNGFKPAFLSPSIKGGFSGDGHSVYNPAFDDTDTVSNSFSFSNSMTDSFCSSSPPDSFYDPPEFIPPPRSDLDLSRGSPPLDFF